MLIKLLTLSVGFLILFAIHMYMTESDNIKKIRNDIRELRAEIKHVGRLTIKTTKMVYREYSTFDDYINNDGCFTCEVCGHRHKTPVPTCWGCGREVVSDDGSEE